MNSDISGQADTPVSPGSDMTAFSSAPPRKPKGGLIAVLIILAFIGGIVAALWGIPHFQKAWLNKGDDTPSADANTQNGMQPLLENAASDPATPTPTQPANTTVTSLDVATLEARLAAVSAKLDDISKDADAAGGNAARAEGLLIAAAVRRALDRGMQLGYLENELRLRFGNSQPRAVTTLINAAHTPITLSDLQFGLDQVAPALLGTGGKKSDWWTATRRELANLIVIRKADDPSAVPQKVIARARLLLANGRANTALQEIERLPDHQKADDWLQMARKYNEARRALDVIDAAAILEPRTTSSIARHAGGQSMQVAPPPPATGNQESAKGTATTN